METKKFTEETLTANVKRKHISLAIEYCLENKIEFIVTPGNSSDDFIMGFVIRDMASAVALGMSLKELKIDPNGLPAFTSASVLKNNQKKTNPVAKEEESTVTEPIPLLENTLKFDMETAG